MQKSKKAKEKKEVGAKALSKSHHIAIG